MPLDFRNTNSLWASVAVETLARLGLQTVILCPGSRSTPLTFAFAAHPAIESLPILDERSAAFFALGCIKRQHRPVAIVCTSGTAGANFYPAVIEAHESGLPLLVFTADRPPEMRDCMSGQTIDQQKLYGSFAKHYSELAVPVATEPMLAYLRQTMVSGWRQAIAPFPGPIHFNCPFRDPLPPLSDSTTVELQATFNAERFTERFFQSVRSPTTANNPITLPLPIEQLPIEQLPTEQLPIEHWQSCNKGLIIAGPSNPPYAQGYCQQVSELSKHLGWPVLAEGLSPLRNYHCLNDALISAYDTILRDSQRSAALVPTAVIQLGALPISKVLRQWLQHHQPSRWVVGSHTNSDPLHGPTQQTSTELASIVQSLKSATSISQQQDYRRQWLGYERSARQILDAKLATETALVESKAVWLLSQHLPEETPLFIANSMPVRDVEYFWPLNNRRIAPSFSRGANGIDGTLSTAMGLSSHNLPTVALTGDLAFLHDTNGLLNAAHVKGHLTVIVINNHGGGIFEMLPISQFQEKPEDFFETYFVTPQQVDLFSLCKAYGIEHHAITGVKDFVDRVSVLPTKGVRVLEVMCDRKQSVHQRKALLESV